MAKKPKVTVTGPAASSAPATRPPGPCAKRVYRPRVSKNPNAYTRKGQKLPEPRTRSRRA